MEMNIKQRHTRRVSNKRTIQFFKFCFCFVFRLNNPNIIEKTVPASFNSNSMQHPKLFQIIFAFCFVLFYFFS